MKNVDHSFLKTEPTRWQAIVFSGKAWVHRMRRAIRRPSHEPCALDHRALAKDGSIIAQSVSPLYSSDTEAEFALQAGKVQNLRRVAASLNGLFLPAGEVFSFWKNVPRPTAQRGYAPGRELREGCVIPSIGGGLCQLTNSLYDAALTAGFEIVERHAHSRRLPGSMAEIGRDATVFWNYVDLRFRATVDIQIEVRLSRWKLPVAYRQIGEARAQSTPASRTVMDAALAGPEAESCETCGVTSCFRNPSAASLPKRTTTAWLVDAYWPEHDRYMASAKAPGDSLLLPLRSKRFNLGPYHWRAGFSSRCRTRCRRNGGAGSRRKMDYAAHRSCRASTRQDANFALGNAVHTVAPARQKRGLSGFHPRTERCMGTASGCAGNGNSHRARRACHRGP